MEDRLKARRRVEILDQREEDKTTTDRVKEYIRQQESTTTDKVKEYIKSKEPTTTERVKVNLR